MLFLGAARAAASLARTLAHSSRAPTRLEVRAPRGRSARTSAARAGRSSSASWRCRRRAPSTRTTGCGRSCASSPPPASRGAGIELDPPGGRAEELLGPDAWELVRPDLARPADHHAPGAPPGQDRAAVARRRSERAWCKRSLDEVGRALDPDPRRGRARGRRQARRARARPARPARRRPRPDRGLPRPRQDADRALVRAGRRASSFGRIQFTPDLMPSDVTGSSIFDQRTAGLRVPARARSSRTSSSPTRSTAPRRRRRRRCSRRCRSAR